MNSTSPVVRLKVTGHVSTHKNSKMLAHGRLFTAPAKQRWMEETIASFLSQLISGSATSDGVTSTERLPLSVIASCVPSEDCWTCVPQMHLSARLVPKGEEGADITIEQL